MEAEDGQRRRRRRATGGEPSTLPIAGLYWLLLAMLAVAVAISILWPEHPLVERFATGTTTEIFGIIITLAFVQRLLQRQERGRRMRASIGAFRRGGRALSRLIRAWVDMLKGVCPDDDPPYQLERLFAPHFTEHLAQLDVQLHGADNRPIVARLIEEMDAALLELNRVVVAYGAILDSTYTEAVDELIDDPFVQLFRDLAARGVDAHTWRTRINTNRGHRDEFFRHLLATADMHDRLAAEAATVRSRDRAPRTGTLGMELPRDHDLKVIVTLDRQWRAGSPAPGSLRVRAQGSAPGAAAVN